MTTFWLVLVIAIPFLFLTGVIYNSLKEQKRLEKEDLPRILKEREEKSKLPDGHPDKKYQKSSYDDDDDDW